MDIVVKKCKKCKNVVWSFNEISTKCCEENMDILVPNSSDASFEKHIPSYELKDGQIIVKVNHVMEKDHYIMWVMIVSDSEIEYKEFKYGDDAVATFKYRKNSKIYSMCNLHDLWVKEVE